MLSNPKLSSLISFCSRYGMAVLLVAAALVFDLVFWQFIQPIASPPFLWAIMITAWRMGFRPGILATVLSGLTIDYFFILPYYQFSGNEPIRIFAFIVEGFILCWLISSLSKAVQETQTSREQLLALSSRQETLREEERKRIALEIHDELGQALTGLKMEIHLLKNQINNDETKKAAQATRKIEDLLRLIDSTVQTVRRISTELRPAILDDLGLIAAIEWQSQEFERRTGISCHVSTNLEDIEIKPESAIAIFRIFQETLTNVARHAEAKSIAVDLRKSDQNIILRIVDNGIGIAAGRIQNNHSLGILGMRERARLIGGELTISRGEKNGTIVLLKAPLS
ncbi:MAG: DUF4118 domain-containing protein [Acidobacteriota bacterium]|nr:DUF4118 domain-containing protein [Acidobacteriota bacterium]